MKIIIVGGGFAGLKLAKELNNKKGFDILLIDRFNYHQFQPLFYQVATAGLDASNISFPLRKAFHNSKNVRIRLAEIEEVVSNDNKIITNIGEFEYDILVIATGATTNFFKNEQLASSAWPMKSTVEAIQLRHHLIEIFEEALQEKNSDKLKQLMTVVIAGGGPTGVELAGAISEMKKYVLPKDYPELDFKKMDILLVEGSEKIMGTMSEKSSLQSKQYLEGFGVKVLTHTYVQEYDGEKLTFKNGESLLTSTLIWAAGITGNVPRGIKPDLIVRGNRILVDNFNKIKDLNNIYAIGDIACMASEVYPNGHPQVAPVALGQAKKLAENFSILLSGKSKMHEFKYHDKGSMATIGRNRAVVDIPKPKLHFKGFFAWIIWMFLHLLLILGVKNKLFVFLNWAYNYSTYDQSLRLVFNEFSKRKSISTNEVLQPKNSTAIV